MPAPTIYKYLTFTDLSDQEFSVLRPVGGTTHICFFFAAVDLVYSHWSHMKQRVAGAV